MFKSAVKKWRQYRYRFVPWIAMNLKDRSVRAVPKGSEDAIISSTSVHNTLLSFFTMLEEESKDIKNSASLYSKNLTIMSNCIGFIAERKPSQLEGGGQGVFVTRGRVPAKTVVSMYPAIVNLVNFTCPQTLLNLSTIYETYESIFFQSLGNPFIFRCIDGVLIDGNDKNMSKFIYKSCHGRDRIGPYLSCDQTWLTSYPVNPLAVGQYVNNQSRSHPANVAYQEFDIPADFPLKLRKYIPNVHYSSSIDNTSKRLTRVVVLVSTREIVCGEELFSTYFTVVQ